VLGHPSLAGKAIGLASGHIGQLWKAVERWLGLSDDPLLQIALPNPVDQAQEPFLEWPHLEVRNVGQRRARRQARTAREAHVSVTLEGRQDALRHLHWSGGAFGHSEPIVDIRSGWHARVPFVLRSGHPEPVVVLDTPVQPDVCYLTDTDFLSQHRATSALPVGVHHFEVSVQYGAAEIEVETAWVRLTVPPPSSPRLRLSLELVDGPS
jgi:hypothetical protein